MYKTEMHCHSANVSTCAHATAEEIVEKYTAAGYTTIVNTEHINPWTFPRDLEVRTWGEKVSYFIDGYKKLCAAAEGSCISCLERKSAFSVRITAIISFMV